MRPRFASRRRPHQGSWLIAGLLSLALAGAVVAAPPPAVPQPFPIGPAAPVAALPTVSLEAAISWALEHNPEIAAYRQQRGIAAAGVVIARTYPFNPIYEGRARPDWGPPSAGVTNAVNQEHRFSLELEIRHQRSIRREAAAANVSRTEYEIAAQELALAVRVARAFDTVFYRSRKLKLIQDTITLNTQAAKQVQELVDAGKLTSADLIVIRTELADARSQLSVGRGALVSAWHDLYRTLGIVEGNFDLCGSFEPEGLANLNVESWHQSALERRPDLKARQVAIGEADAHLRLELANRYGNPTFGPDYEMNETRANFLGVQLSFPVPILNTHKGEIQQRTAELSLATQELHRTEVEIEQDVHAALARLAHAREWLETYRQELLPTLDKALKDMRTLFEARAPGVDLLRYIDVQRKLLQARSSELDALYEVHQAQADLAAAVGDPLLGVTPCVAKP